jgi:hypothetical protein
MLTPSDLVAMSCSIANNSLNMLRVLPYFNVDEWVAVGKQYAPDFIRLPVSPPAGITKSAARMALDALKAHDVVRALDYAREALEIADLVAFPPAQLLSRCLYCRALMEHEELERAAMLLNETLVSAEQARNKTFIRISNLLLAECALRRGHGASALSRLRGAIGWSEPFDLVEAEIVASQSLASLCVQALDADVEARDVRELIKELHLRPDPPPLHVSNWPWAVQIRTFGATEIALGIVSCGRAS